MLMGHLQAKLKDIQHILVPLQAKFMDIRAIPVHFKAIIHVFVLFSFILEVFV